MYSHRCSNIQLAAWNLKRKEEANTHAYTASNLGREGGRGKASLYYSQALYKSGPSPLSSDFIHHKTSFIIFSPFHIPLFTDPPQQCSTENIT